METVLSFHSQTGFMLLAWVSGRDKRVPPERVLTSINALDEVDAATCGGRVDGVGVATVKRGGKRLETGAVERAVELVGTAGAMRRRLRDPLVTVNNIPMMNADIVTVSSLGGGVPSANVHSAMAWSRRTIVPFVPVTSRVFARPGQELVEP